MAVIIVTVMAIMSAVTAAPGWEEWPVIHSVLEH